MSARDELPAFRLGRGGALVWDDRGAPAPGAAPGAPRAAYVDIMRSLSGAAADPRARAAVCTSVDLRAPRPPVPCAADDEDDDAEAAELAAEARRGRAALRQALDSRRQWLAGLEAELRGDVALRGAVLGALGGGGAPAAAGWQATMESAPADAWPALRERLRAHVDALAREVAHRDEERRRRREEEEEARARAEAEAEAEAKAAAAAKAEAEAKAAAEAEAEARAAKKKGSKAAKKAKKAKEKEAPAAAAGPGGGGAGGAEGGGDEDPAVSPGRRELVSRFLEQFIAVAWKENPDDEPDWYDAYVQAFPIDDGGGGSVSALLYYGDTNEQESIDLGEFAEMVGSEQIRIVDAGAIDFSNWMVVPRRVAESGQARRAPKKKAPSQGSKRKRG